MDTVSLWERISKRTVTYPELETDVEVDVAIIGGGITGVTAAAHLIRAGKKVAIVEAGKIGGYTTGYSTGNLYIPVQPFYQKIVDQFNFETAQSVAHSRKLAIDYIEKNIKEKNISCHFSRRPWYGYTADHERISLDKEVECLKKMGMDIDYTHDMPLAFKFKKAVLMPNQARFNPLQYVISMADDLAAQGCLVFENSRVMEMDEKDVCFLKTSKAKIIAKKIVIATHTPIGIHSVQMLTAPYRSYVVSVRLNEKEYPEGHFWDLDRPPHATCTHAENGVNPELLMVAGSHHKVGQAKDTTNQYQELEKFLREHFSVAEVAYQWSAQHYQSADKIPYIGLASRKAKHTYIATGYFADGLVYGTLAGLIICDAILNEKNPLSETYQSKRFNPFSVLGFVSKENSNVFLQYLKDIPSFSTPDFSTIKAGEGKVLTIDNEKCGVSRDNNNQLHIVSAVCTHMKCIVNWNNAEKSWDCPCHGSRFTPTGKVIEGPAIHDLEPKKLT